MAVQVLQSTHIRHSSAYTKQNVEMIWCTEAEIEENAQDRTQGNDQDQTQTWVQDQDQG